MKLNSYFKAICMGIVAGMRSMSAPAFVSNHLARKGAEELNDSNFKLMASETTAKVLTVAAVGELIADKLPNIPARIEPQPLIARAISGAVCGAAICKSEGERADVGAILGGLAAIGSSYAFYYLRRSLSETEILPDPVIALGEDALVVAVSVAALSDEE